MINLTLLRGIILTGILGTTAIAASPNILLITADDLNCSSVGVYGCKTKDSTPNIDRLANAGIRFDHSHVTIAVCQPSRSVWMTGRYPMHSGGEGFHQLSKPNIPILPALLRKGGYTVGILGKSGHSTPIKFKWDMNFDQFQLGAGRNATIYAARAKTFVEQAAKSGKPFFLMANSHDPHRPFYGNDPEKWYTKKGPKKSAALKPSKVFKPEEVVIPGFLPDIPDVRLEIAEYFSSVRRCDDTVGALLNILDETGVANNTLVIFLSDNGMAFPFAKTNCYLHSTRTPFLVRWPANIKAGSVEQTQMVSGIDITPTILEVAGLKQPAGMDGRSFLSICQGKQQPARDRVYTQFHQTAAKRQYEMRTVQTTQFGYIYNAWANQETPFKNESMNGRTYKAMQAAGASNAAIQARVKLFLTRIPEELYDFGKDPDGLNNLAKSPEYRKQLLQFRKEMTDWMIKQNDPEQKKYQSFLKGK
ncbi:MAG: N-sulfoglucosamine sulfohydrolase [Rubritalea sp.]|jgi:N-sulfoglucosamine sulfohydrolase